jgi:hypothetical protein
MLRLAYIALLPALLLRAQSPPALDEYLDALARTAATFADTAPGLTAQETLDQRGRRGFVKTLRGKKDEIKNLDVTLPQDFSTHHVVSSYALAEIGEGHVLHEIRTIVTMDGKSLATADEAHHALTLGLRSADDRTKRKLLEDLEHNQLEGAATDFGQLILLFAKRLQKDYDFSLAADQELGGEPVAVLGYRQISGAQGLTVFKERTEDRQSATGQVWLRRKDLLPIRITMNTGEALSKKFTIRTEATVDYMPSAFGLVPESVIHKQFLSAGPTNVGSTNDSLMVENDYHYTDFNHENVRIP